MPENPRPPVGLTFALAGFSKCGTTSLSAALARHPQVLMPTHKEPWFFSHAVIPDAWPEYVAQFPGWQQYEAVGDDSTTYTAYQCVDTASRRLAEHYPTLRILIIARDSIDRIESSFREMQHSSHLFGESSPRNLDEALETRPQLIADSRYFDTSAPYRELFDEDQIKVVFLEDFQSDESGLLAECLEFIGVDPALMPAESTGTRLNAGDAKYRDSALLWRMRLHPLTRRAVASRGDQR